MEVKFENIEEKVVQEIASQIMYDEYSNIKRQVDEIVSKKMEKVIDEAIVNKINSIIGTALDEKYIPVDKYGTSSKETTLKEIIISHVKLACDFKTSNYSSDWNYYTKSIYETVNKTLESFKKEYNEIMDKQLLDGSRKYAIEKLSKSLGIELPKEK